MLPHRCDSADARFASASRPFANLPLRPAQKYGAAAPTATSRLLTFKLSLARTT